MKRTHLRLVVVLAGFADIAHSAKKQRTEPHVDCPSVAIVTPVEVARDTAPALLSAGGSQLMPPPKRIPGDAGICGDQATPSKEMAVTVHVIGIVPMVVLSQAEAIAARMFSAIGIRIAWRFGQSVRRVSGRDRAIMVHVATHTPATRLPTALASALPYQGSHITIFYDRVEKEIEHQYTATLLAHVLVHEIAHILEGISRHSATGIMKADWAIEDKWNMIHRPLTFAPEDIRLIRLGLGSPSATLGRLPRAKTAVSQPKQLSVFCVEC